jgi:ATP-dependent Lon protease
MLSGIALLDGLPFRVQCSIVLRKGDGDIYISGPVDNTIEESINESIGFANTICDHEGIKFPSLGNKNILVRIGLPLSHAPIVGPSLGLLLGLQLTFAITGRRPPYHAFVTGELNSKGDVFAVGGIAAKRKGAAELGGERLVLPASQLDFFSTEIIQIPVTSIFEAYSILTYGDKSGKTQR